MVTAAAATADPDQDPRPRVATGGPVHCGHPAGGEEKNQKAEGVVDLSATKEREDQRHQISDRERPDRAPLWTAQ